MFGPLTFAAGTTDKPTPGTAQPGATETRVCPGCGATIAATSAFCPYCHRYLPDAKVAGPKKEPTPEEIRREQIKRIPKPESGAVFYGGCGGLFTAAGGAAYGGQGYLGLRLGRSGVGALGLGYQKWSNANSIPVSVMFRRYYFRERTSPFLFFRGTYDYTKLIHYWTDENGKPLDDGSGATILFGFGLALGRPVAAKFDFEIGLGLSYFTQWIRYYYPDFNYWSDPFSEVTTSTAFGVSVGVTN
jgi:hypothetical protein